MILKRSNKNSINPSENCECVRTSLILSRPLVWSIDVYKLTMSNKTNVQSSTFLIPLSLCKNSDVSLIKDFEVMHISEELYLETLLEVKIWTLVLTRLVSLVDQ